MRKYLTIGLITTLFIFGYKGTFAQQDPMYSQYMFNLLPVNPAYTGIKNHTNFSLNSRFQWLKLEGAPVTNHFSANTSLYGGRAGVGLIISSDRLGIESIGQYFASYGYNIQASNGILSFGLQTGVITRKVDPEELSLRFDNDPFFDQSLFNQTSQFNVGTGIMYLTESWMVGISVPRLLRSPFNPVNDGHRFERHVYVTGAYIFSFKPGLRFKPMFMVRKVEGAPLSIEANAQAIINNKYWVGLFTDDLNTLGAIFQLDLSQKYRFGYSFELYKGSGLQSPFFSHELALSINMALFKEQDVYIRYF